MTAETIGGWTATSPSYPHRTGPVRPQLRGTGHTRSREALLADATCPQQGLRYVSGDMGADDAVGTRLKMEAAVGGSPPRPPQITGVLSLWTIHHPTKKRKALLSPRRTTRGYPGSRLVFAGGGDDLAAMGRPSEARSPCAH
jgi:hypothetical protein